MNAPAPAREPAVMRFARWVSIFGHPFVMAVVMAAVAGLHFSDGMGGAPTALLTTLPILPVAWLMRRQVRAGAWEHVDASRRSERPVLYLVATVSFAVVLFGLWWWQPQSYLLRGVIGGLALVLACALANRWIKVSLHMAFAALAATVLSLLPSIVGFVLLAALPLLAWSRLRLARHTGVEVALGVVLGAVAGLAIRFA